MVNIDELLWGFKQRLKGPQASSALPCSMGQPQERRKMGLAIFRVYFAVSVLLSKKESIQMERSQAILARATFC